MTGRTMAAAVCAALLCAAQAAAQSPELPQPPETGMSKADVIEATATRAADGTWSFRVTVAHDDEGWDHYADRWEVLSPEGDVLATRVLLHPHVGEQPFTRSLPGVVVPPGVERVRVRAHDSVHGYGGDEATVDLSASP